MDGSCTKNVIFLMQETGLAMPSKKIHFIMILTMGWVGPWATYARQIHPSITLKNSLPWTLLFRISWIFMPD
ncbi:uncharacterized protein METZ01_LOCUS111898 [marine metagenome]|uniref:Uncharacterized protein n=1 Tax=marine metagenome TaxID=408172 RepID=A0A381X2R1_9ZZZZ